MSKVEGLRVIPGHLTRAKTTHLTRSKTPQMTGAFGEFLLYTEGGNGMTF
jgi:hypothetical protein